MMHDDGRSLGDEATFAGRGQARPRADASLGDERTLGGGDAGGLDTVMDDIEVVDLESRYRIEAPLGQGGMGAVLLATDTRLGRKVAIKRILGEAASSRTAVSRFLTEAKAIAAISHPNVVQIYDYGRTKDGPFLIMEYVDGSSLLDRCRDGALPLEEAVDLACQLCDGLAKAHDLGIVHRDIKPANVLLTRDGLPKLTDFGLAKAEAMDHQMTMTGAVLGTPDFMPPEQRRDAALVDARSDLWSLTATLYQMVTGRSPKIIRFNDVPGALQDVLAKALEEAKDDRFQSARELRDALRASLVATAPAAAELGEGQCPACGVNNDSSRRFCRGCGESLEAPCLSCNEPIPTWEEICGACGAKQKPLLEERRSDMAARQAEAESLLRNCDFEAAERLTVAIRDEADPRLRQFVPWATAYLATISGALDAHVAEAVARLAEALEHEAAHDYPAAINALERVPAILHERALPGQPETVSACLTRIRATHAEVQMVESVIRERIAAGDLGDLRRHVERLEELHPDHPDRETFLAHLERLERQVAARRIENTVLAERRKLDEQRARLSAALDGELRKQLARLREDEDWETGQDKIGHSEAHKKTLLLYQRDKNTLDRAAAQVLEAGSAARKRLTECGMAFAEPVGDTAPLPDGDGLLREAETLRAQAVAQANEITKYRAAAKSFASGVRSAGCALSLLLVILLGVAGLTLDASLGIGIAVGVVQAAAIGGIGLAMGLVYVQKLEDGARARLVEMTPGLAATIARFDRCKSAGEEFLASRRDAQTHELDETHAKAVAARRVKFERRVAACTAARDHKLAELESRYIAATETLAKKAAADRREQHR